MSALAMMLIRMWIRSIVHDLIKALPISSSSSVPRNERPSANVLARSHLVVLGELTEVLVSPDAVGEAV
jgi:hypothetical protein